MSPQNTAQFLEAEIGTLTEAIWSQVLSLDIIRMPDGSVIDESDQVLTGCVQITGKWEGAVLVDCTLPLARAAASAMFKLDPHAASIADLKDAIGELTNMCGGNIKALVPGPCYLSLPMVVHGLEHRLRIPGTCVLSRLAYETNGGMFTVTLLGRADSSGAS